MWTQPVIQLSADPLITIVHLNMFSGSEDEALSRIPLDLPGIYAWFRTYTLDDTVEGSFEQLKNAVDGKKFADRRARIEPNHEILLSSRSQMSERRLAQLRSAIESPGFKTQLATSLRFSFLFQAPLYVGKATNLRERISQHLRDATPLRARLAEAGIDLSRCSLLYLGLPAGSGGEFALMDDDYAESGAETLLEDLFSRLFMPHFTLRYG